MSGLGLAPSSLYGVFSSGGTSITSGGGGGGSVFLGDDGKGRIRIVLTATTGTLASVTRRHPSGRVIPVRNMTLVPLSGGTAIGYDYEMPVGVQVEYVASIYDSSDPLTPLDTTEPVSITWMARRDWLKDPLEPIRNVMVLVNDMSEYDYATPTAVHTVLGRPDPVTVGEIRQAATGDLTLVTLDKLARDQLHYITASGHVLLLQSTQESGVGNMYLAPLGLKEQRVTPLRDQQERYWTLTYQEVSAPVGDAAAFTTWQDVLDTYATWQNVVDQNTSWLEMIENLNSTATPVILQWRGA